MKKILDEPKLEQKLIDAQNDGTLAIFIGAGVSRLVGCMGWDQLSQKLIHKCHNLKKEDGSNLINYKEFDKLSLIKDQRKLISIAYKLMQSNNYKNEFKKLMKKALLYKKKLKRPNIYDTIARFNALNITTNADELFDSAFTTKNIKYKTTHFDPDQISKRNLYHIHGSLRDFDSIVFTISQYFRAYREGSFLPQLLEHIFTNYTVLFVGYGLSEFELLEFIIPKSEDKIMNKRFLLNGYYLGEENLLEMDQGYYGEMGIEVLPYSMDCKGYSQINEILKSWADEMNIKSTNLSKNLALIDETI